MLLISAKEQLSNVLHYLPFLQSDRLTFILPYLSSKHSRGKEIKIKSAVFTTTDNAEGAAPHSSECVECLFMMVNLSVSENVEGHGK